MNGDRQTHIMYQGFDVSTAELKKAAKNAGLEIYGMKGSVIEFIAKNVVETSEVLAKIVAEYNVVSRTLAIYQPNNPLAKQFVDSLGLSLAPPYYREQGQS